MDQLWGKNWLRTPEVIQAYQAALASTTLDFKLVRAFTDVLTKGALVIPVYEVGRARADRPYVVADFSDRGFCPAVNYENW